MSDNQDNRGNQSRYQQQSEEQKERQRQYHRERYRRIRAEQGHTPPSDQGQQNQQQNQQQQNQQRGNDRGQANRDQGRGQPNQQQEQGQRQDRGVTLVSDEDRLRRAGWDENNQRVMREELLSVLDLNDRLLETLQKSDPRDVADKLFDAFNELDISDWDYPVDDLRVHRSLIVHLIDILSTT